MKSMMRTIAATIPALISTLAGTSLAIEADIAAIAPIQNILPNAFGSVMLRSNNEKVESKSTIRTQARYYLGSTFFNDALKSQIVFGVSKETNKTEFKKRDIELENQLVLVENDNFKLYPYLLVTAADTSTNVTLSITAQPKYTMSTGIGELKLFGHVELGGYSSNRADRAVVRDAGADEASSLSLSAEDEGGPYTAEAQANRLYTDLRTGISFTPAALRNLQLEYRTEHVAKYSPIHQLSDDKDRVVVEKKGSLNRYEISYQREHVIKARYDFSDTLYAKNEFFLKTRYNDKAQYENVLSLVADIF